MKTILPIIVLACLVSVASAQCPGGKCVVNVPVEVTVAAPSVRTPVRSLIAKQPVRAGLRAVGQRFKAVRPLKRLRKAVSRLRCK